jgi:signal transduction histidine kinase
MAVAAVFRFLAAGLYVFLAGVIFGQRRTRPAGGAMLILLAAMAVWNMAWPPVLAGAGWAAAMVAAGCTMQVLRFASLPFGVTLGILFTLWALGLAAGAQSTLAAVASTAMGVYLAGSFYWKQTFGLALTNRSLFAVGLGIFVALYLFAVRALAGLVEWSWALEMAVLFGAGLLWIPVYAWISRFLSRRTEMLAGFSTSLIEEASRILDLERRMEFIARQVSERTGAKAMIVFAGRQAPEGDHDAFNSRFPLRVEDRDTGNLLVDTGARRFRNDEESLLRALAPQIAQSLEAARLMEEKIRLERELARQENLAEMGQAAAAIAHEIKNPLSSIKALVQVLGEDPAVAEGHGESLQHILNEIGRLDRSLRQLLGFARTPPERNETVDLSKLLWSLLAAVKAPVASEVESGLVLRNTSEDLLRQVFLNLLLNAAQAAKSKVWLKAVRREGGVTVTVRDDGPGIPEHLRERVFAPFFTTKQRGTGLGLTIVRNNLKALGGELSMECPDRGGTTMTVRFND